MYFIIFIKEVTLSGSPDELKAVVLSVTAVITAVWTIFQEIRYWIKKR